MRIAFIAHLSEISGAGIALVATASAFHKMGHTVFLVVPGNGPLGDRARAAGVSVAVIENPEQSLVEGGAGAKPGILTRRWKYVAELRRFLAQERFDIAYINSSASVFAGVSAWMSGVPVVWHIHETLTNPGRATKVKQAIIRRVARRLIYASESGRRSFPPGGIPSMIGRNAVDLERLRQVRDRRRGEPAEEAVLFSHGTVRLKGTDLLLQAVRIMQEGEPPLYARVVVTGAADADPEFYAELKAMAQEPGLKGRVDFVGIHDSLAGFLEQADVYVSASRNEAMPIAVVEAMAAGVPVVATRVGDCGDLLEEGGCGWVVEPENAEALAVALVEVLTKPDEARRRARAAVEKVERLYGGGNFWDELHDFVTGAVGS